jgi:hypothetical protein
VFGTELLAEERWEFLYRERMTYYAPLFAEYGVVTSNYLLYRKIVQIFIILGMKIVRFGAWEDEKNGYALEIGVQSVKRQEDCVSNPL